MSNAKIITDELVRSLAPNSAAIFNGKKISANGDFSGLSKTADETLIFGECRGSGKNPYRTSADFSGDSPVFRCSCPSRQFPCKHSLALMFEWLAGKTFEVAEIPDDVAGKREKAAKRAEKAASPAAKKSAPNKAAARKKLQKQQEGLVLAEDFVKDMLNRGVYSVNNAAAEQYRSLAKQMGDYWLPGIQAIMNEIVSYAVRLSGEPDDLTMRKITALLVRLSSTVKKSKAYIAEKLESGEVLPENNILYEEMGGVWKLTQLRDIGLFKENVRLVQLAFREIMNYDNTIETDLGFWINIDSGDISKTETIIPVKAAKHIKKDASANGVYNIPAIYIYPGGANPRVRWEAAEIADADSNTYSAIMECAADSISDTVKKAKNELKNTISEPYYAALLKFDEIGFAADGHAVMRLGGESISLCSIPDFEGVCEVLSVTDSRLLENGALLGLLHYLPEERKISLCPLSIIHNDGITKLC